MLTSHNVILGIQTVDVATSKYATFIFLCSLRNSGFVFSGGIFSSHLNIISTLLPLKITQILYII